MPKPVALSFIACLSMTGVAAHAADDFLADITTLELKAEHCRGEISAAGAAGKLCRDFQQYAKRLLQGDEQNFIRVHLFAGDITRENTKFVSDVLRSVDETEAMLR